MTALSNAARRSLTTKLPSDVVILSSVRSPVTRAFKGGFRDAWPEDLIGPVMKAAVTRAKIAPKDVKDVLIGNVLAELGFAKTGRMALNHAGFPNSTTFHTVNRQCSSSLQAVTHLAHAIMVGQIEVGLAGGVESMSRNYKATRGIPQDLSPRLRGSEVKEAADCIMPMGITSENVAEKFGITREMQDEFAFESQRRASAARSEGRFEREIVGVETVNVGEDGKEEKVLVTRDDGIRDGLTLEKIKSMKAAFKEDGGSTAGNSSQISDGAAATILCRRSWADARGLKPIGRFIGTQVAGCEPALMGISPIYAIPALLKHTGFSLSDIDITELNEAFASQAVYCIQELGLDEKKVNPNGGAIAIGHPTGATGARQLATLMNELDRSGKEKKNMISNTFRRTLLTSSSFLKIAGKSNCRVSERVTRILQRRKMNVSAIDSRIFRSLFGTEEIRNVFSDTSYMHHCIAVELALARAQSALSIIPPQTGATLTQTLKDTAPSLNYSKLEKETEIVGYPILPLITQLQALSDGESGKYIHWGATTQDIMDTASILQMKKGLGIIEKGLRDVIKALEGLSEKYRDVPMAGRTHLQHALPVTFGYKAAVWLSSFQRHLERLEQLKPRVLLVQYGGAAGTLASLGNKDDVGLKVRAELAKELDLENPSITWHVARDGPAEILNFLALLGGSLGKVALDLMILSSNEYGEVSEPFVPHRGASSTMPQKRNPISSELMLAASKVLRSNAGLGLDAMVSDFERASGPWHLEWVAVPDSFVMAVGALHQADFVLSGLVVHEQVMEKNLKSSRGLIVGEAVMMGLAPHLGRGRSHDVVYKACKEAIEEGKSLFEVLVEEEEVVKCLGKEGLGALCEEKEYLGMAGRMVDEVLGKK
ncbi:hypothetical protein HYALB_00005543 [Hymenoscyphus albidus]|uniref:Adenylosuccinate lyase C-terminal domain-containing protein n=1 Tax=Hymenoscyphus albidus TaxID=595503 RepID=A0A9N9LZI0_9HELO|nr:hypothetical protein HYALB_00005543 [Hymenoscyphus albidus]